MLYFLSELLMVDYSISPLLFTSSIPLVNVRLTLSSQSNYGRVEVQRVDEGGKLGIWGGICDNGFGNTEAGVVCRQLGYRYTTL